MIGSTISHYTILEKLGEGGMGVVYKARDTKLDRDVALKFLPDRITTSPDDLARFTQEAKAAAALSHPNICTIFGIEESDGRNFIVMEYVDGQMLEEKKHSLTQKQALETGIQIAEGLAAAHEKGIVHRDIKPENIMIRKDGRVLIMDFGLAKFRGASRLTKEGSTVGTAGYMSPEQVQGQETDHRSDIFSLGVLLYEMLTGEAPFKGLHETAISYEIVNVDPAPMSAIRPEIPAELDAIVLECLEKDPRERTQSAGQVALDLKKYRRESSRQKASRITAARPMVKLSSHEREAVHTAEQPETKRAFLPWIVAGALGIATVALAVLYSAGPPHTDQVIRALIPSPSHTFFAQQSGGNSSGGQISISPDGRKIAFVAVDSSGNTNLYVRALNSLAALPLPNTQGAYYPFWSPKNDFVGFFMNGKLEKIDASGGPPLTICDAPSGRGGSWSKDDVIVFAPSYTGPLFQVPAAGGVASQVTRLDSARQETTHRFPCFLPDGIHFLFFAGAGGENSDEGVMVGSLDGSTLKKVSDGHSDALYANGYLLFVRQQILLAQPFDADKLELRGNAVPIAEQIRFDLTYNRGSFAASQNGLLIFEGGVGLPLRQLAIINRAGTTIRGLKGAESVQEGAFSPDGKKVAYSSFDNTQRNEDIWVYDIEREIKTRLTFEPRAETDPIWSPDGKHILYYSNKDAKNGIYQKNADGTGSDEEIVSHPTNIFPTSWSQDGKWIATTTDPRRDIVIYPAEGKKSPNVFLNTDFVEEEGRFSPDGKWILYMADESGQQEVYVRPFPGPGGKWQVSSNGIAYRAFWKGDGKEIYYISRDGKMMAAEVSASGSSFSVGQIKTLFDAYTKGVSILDDVSRDGERFLVVYNPVESNSDQLTLVTNWNAELPK
jgi:serine/threonine protein kinase